ncbi:MULTISPECIES: hypothetical protein [Methanoculleus]|uniref:Uncharacterized protein n=2 Tax=Methanoculleus TaxID=45989 RepID=A3CYF5_METMJ|nr:MULTISPECIES: hypothetical protein [Methanoculleus]ABN58405.1 hypothetical protein Memar_2484 [Methanoculleus marisnigri JR1]MCC7555080.1 hypothetical protein [Methanoculleus marisnigri]UYU17403.1 hypothetical protein OH143_06695 [Methanoculleus submarinus]
MLERAGYLQNSRCAAADEWGRPCRIVEIALDGRRFGARAGDLQQALGGRYPARVRLLRDDWGPVLGDTVGRAERSRTGKAVVFELVTGERYTVPAAALRAVLARAAAFAPVSAILPAGIPAARQQVLVTG